jgi:alpha-1,3-fucosyltransferase 10
MSSPEFYEFLSNYKFILSMENAVCDDYVTEKYWRTLFVGSVPIVYGSKRIKDLYPDEKSAIDVRDFENAEELAKFLQELNDNDEEYESYLKYKTDGVKNKHLIELMENRKWGINNDRVRGNFIERFECVVCERLHENIEKEKANEPVISHIATKEHYGCPVPKTFNQYGKIVDDDPDDTYNNHWKFSFEFAYCTKQVFFNKFLAKSIFNFTSKELEKEAFAYYTNVYMKNKTKLDL